MELDFFFKGEHLILKVIFIFIIEKPGATWKDF